MLCIQSKRKMTSSKPNYPINKIIVAFKVVETEQGKHSVSFDFEENDVNMKEVGLLLYRIKRFEQELIERDWGGEDGYEITNEDEE